MVINNFLDWEVVVLLFKADFFFFLMKVLFCTFYRFQVCLILSSERMFNVVVDVSATLSHHTKPLQSL